MSGSRTAIKVLQKAQPPLLWIPQVGDFTEEFLRRKDSELSGPSYKDLTEGDNCVLVESQRILGRCLPPSESSGSLTGLVVGYVQSGKTLSFETVMSLARDNGFGAVIVLAGTKINLKDQSEQRLKKDLGIDEGSVWYHVSNPTTANVGEIQDRISAWQRNPIKRRAVLVTVLKHPSHLGNLVDTLKKLPLNEVPVLIIDDEGDQAGLNNKAARNRKTGGTETSSTYDWICQVRSKVPHHSYLLYTATPQANLLLARTDLLDPSFAELVTPGPAYTGGKLFFSSPRKLVVEIPSSEVPSRHNIVIRPPKTLISALRYFLLAAAHHSITMERGKDRNRSMMVHPAMPTDSHKEYKGWTETALKTLRGFVEREARRNPQTVADRFEKEYAALKDTFPRISSLDKLIEAMVEDVFTELLCVEVNSTQDAEKHIEWNKIPYWILVGGNKLDRGYTVEGLCVTYMPRDLGSVPAADTLQQRARFFGYKKAYLGLCRVFLQPNVAAAFTEYVEHEESVRVELERWRGKPLREWRRDFVLDSILRPTRTSVVGLSVRRITVDEWMVPGALQRDPDALAFNRKLLRDVRTNWEQRFGKAINAAEIPRFKPASGLSPHSFIQSVPLETVLTDFLLKIQVRDPVDAEAHSASLVSIAELIRSGDVKYADVFLVNDLESNYRKRDAGRGWPEGHINAPINYYFSQSAGTVNDSQLRVNDRITLHLRKFNLGPKLRGAETADVKDVTWYALHFPGSTGKGTVIEGRK